jgi:hypothetical protein
VLPDFLGIGAQKAGTTWLARNLAAHPQIWMPPIKEIHYFDRPPDWRDPVKLRVKERGGRASLRELYWERKYNRLPRDDRWYASLFEPKKGQIAGDITPAYAVLDEAALSRVHRLVPEAKILYFMRNPVERTWSQTVMYFDRYGRDVEAATVSELREHFELERVRRRAEYLRTLEDWRRFYPEERIFVGFLEDTHFHPAELLGYVYEFLGVDPTFEPSGAGQKVHSRSSASMPTEAAVTLARAYLPDLERLQGQFGGYASFWLYCAKRLLEGSLGCGGRVAYPLWESPAWGDWLKETGREKIVEAGPQSGRLSHHPA